MSPLRICLVACSLLIVAYSQNQQRNEYELKNNTYSTLLIAIGNDIPEDMRIIDRLKDYFTKASAALLVATRGRAFLQNITILVPQNWTSKNWTRATYETFDIANVVVDEPHPDYGVNPYVQQLGQCGEPGQYMHLTTGFLLRDDIVYNFGPIGKILVHEFAHLRYGVFDEYAIDALKQPHFYNGADGTAKPVRCSKKIDGFSVNSKTGALCVYNQVTSLPEEDCRFYPSDNTNQGTGSLMFWNFMSKVTGFCDNDTSDELNLHNADAPNQHNIMCNQRSQWEVITEHRDFKGQNPPLPNYNGVDTAPSFNVVQRQSRKIVIVLDVSGSMNTNSRLRKMVVAATTYLNDTLEQGAWMGMVKFSSSASKLHEIIEIDGGITRQSLIEELPTYASGGTCIGCGLRLACQMLENKGFAAGGTIFLLSDGIENNSPRIEDVKPELAAKGIVVDSIIYTQAADDKLFALSRDTRGMAFFSSDDDVTGNLGEAFVATVKQRIDDDAVQLLSDSKDLAKDEKLTLNFHIDSTIGKDTTLELSWVDPNIGPFLLTLSQPDGNIYVTLDVTNATIVNQAITIVVQDAQRGEWNLHVTNIDQTNMVVRYTITSRPASDDVKPITIESKLNTPELDFKDVTTTPRIIIYGIVNRGYSPVLGADVKATVIIKDRGEYVITLRDTGSGADTTVDDGIYSGYFLKYTPATSSLKYTYKVKVVGDPAVTTVKTAGGGGAQAALNVNGTFPVADPVFEKTDAFARDSNSAFFAVANSPPSDSPLLNPPPSRINDLKVIQADFTNLTVKLQWTAVGANLDEGTASEYVIKYHTNMGELRDTFENVGTVLTQQNISTGNLTSPLSSGNKEVFTISLAPDQRNITYAFALQVSNGATKSDPSNVVVTALLDVVAINEQIIGPTTIETTIETTSEPPNTTSTTPKTVADPPFPLLELSLGVAIGSFFLVCLVLVVTICLCTRQEKKYKSKCSKPLEIDSRLGDFNDIDREKAMGNDAFPGPYVVTNNRTYEAPTRRSRMQAESPYYEGLTPQGNMYATTGRPPLREQRTQNQVPDRQSRSRMQAEGPYYAELAPQGYMYATTGHPPLREQRTQYQVPGQQSPFQQGIRYYSHVQAP